MRPYLRGSCVCVCVCVEEKVASRAGAVGRQQRRRGSETACMQAAGAAQYAGAGPSAARRRALLCSHQTSACLQSRLHNSKPAGTGQHHQQQPWHPCKRRLPGVTSSRARPPGPPLPVLLHDVGLLAADATSPTAQCAQCRQQRHWAGQLHAAVACDGGAGRGLGRLDPGVPGQQVAQSLVGARGTSRGRAWAWAWACMAFPCEAGRRRARAAGETLNPTPAGLTAGQPPAGQRPVSPSHSTCTGPQCRAGSSPLPR